MHSGLLSRSRRVSCWVGDKTATITLQWNTAQKLRYVALQEYIKLGQRVKKFKIETSPDGKNFTERATQVKQTTIG